MSMYAVKNDEGEWLNVYADSAHWSSEAVKLAVRREQAESRASRFGGHVVELLEASAKVVVSEEEAEMLEQAKRNKYPATIIYNGTNDEDRLMRAYVNGWEVYNPKRWNVKVPHADGYWFYLRENHKLAPISDRAYARGFTDAEIEHYGLQDCEKALEVTDYEQ